MRALGVSFVSLIFVASAFAASTSRPPVIHEPFTPLPCPRHATSTVGIEGCQEQALLASDRTLNELTRRIFVKLRAGERAGFARSEAAWLVYRRGSCAAQSSPTSGGTANGIEALGCELQRNKTHRADLAELLKALSVH